jgi:hypothetical protein
MRLRNALAAAATAALLAELAALFRDGRITVDVDVGRTLVPLGPRNWRIEAPPERVYQLIAAPYLGRTPRALAEKLEVWERGTDMALAAHFTTVGKRRVTTVETVRFELPERISFRLVRGPVPHVAETFELREANGATSFTWSGEIGADFWRLGGWWARRVAAAWERAVEATIDSIASQAERRRD